MESQPLKLSILLLLNWIRNARGLQGEKRCIFVGWCCFERCLIRLLWCEHIHPLAVAVLQELLGRCSWLLSLQCGTRTQTSRVGGVPSSHRNRSSADRKALPALWAGVGNGALEEAASHAWTTLSCSSRWDLGCFPKLSEPMAASVFLPEFALLGNNPAGVGDAAVSCNRECRGLHALCMAPNPISVSLLPAPCCSLWVRNSLFLRVCVCSHTSVSLSYGDVQDLCPTAASFPAPGPGEDRGAAQCQQYMVLSDAITVSVRSAVPASSPGECWGHSAVPMAVGPCRSLKQPAEDAGRAAWCAIPTPSSVCPSLDDPSGSRAAGLVRELSQHLPGHPRCPGAGRGAEEEQTW